MKDKKGMKSFARRFTAVLLAGALALGFTACSEGGTQSGSGNSSGGGDGASSFAKELNVSEEFLESLRGMEVTRVYAWKVEDPDPEDEGYKQLKKLEEEYGFTFRDKGIGGNYVDAMVTSLLANKPYGDILMCPEENFADWFKAGVMTDLAPAAEKLGIDFTESLYEQNIRKYSNVNNGQYGFGYGEDYSVYCSLYYNKRILQENNLEDPYTLLEKGEWTFDKLGEYAKACKKTNPDGTVTQWGLGSWTNHELMVALINGNDGTVVSLDEKNQFQLDLKSSKTTEALEYMYRWCNVDKLANVSEGGWQKTMSDFVDGKYAFVLGTNEVLTLASANGMKDDFGIITFPVGPSNTSGQTDYAMNYRYWFIPACNKDKAEQLLFIDDLIHRSDARSFEEKFEDTYLLKIPDETSYNAFLERSRKAQKYELYQYSGIIWTDPGLYAIASNIFTGQSTPGSTVDKLFDSLNATLRDHWKDVAITG